MRIDARFSQDSTASSEFIMNVQPILLLAACRTLKSDRLLAGPDKELPDANIVFPENAA